MTDQKIDLFDVLNKISKKQDVLADLPQELHKQIAPVVLIRWLSGTSDKQQVYMLNEVANPFVFSLYKEKELIVKLLTVGCSGRSQRYGWIKQKSKKQSTVTKIVAEYYQYSTRHAADVVGLLTDEQILRYCEEMGTDKETVAKVKKELKER